MSGVQGPRGAQGPAGEPIRTSPEAQAAIQASLDAYVLGRRPRTSVGWWWERQHLGFKVVTIWSVAIVLMVLTVVVL